MPQERETAGSGWLPAVYLGDVETNLRSQALRGLALQVKPLGKDDSVKGIQHAYHFVMGHFVF